MPQATGFQVISVPSQWTPEMVAALKQEIQRGIDLFNKNMRDK
jgi:hypothetical protein